MTLRALKWNDSGPEVGLGEITSKPVSESFSVADRPGGLLTLRSPASTDAPDADKNWSALSLPFAIGPKGRIGKLRTEVLKP
jgi:hypothetical protein